MNEQQIVDKISEADHELKLAQHRMAEAKKLLVLAEDDAIAAKISGDRWRERLRQYRSTTPNYVPDLRDIEIAEFRQRFPELCEKDEVSDV